MFSVEYEICSLVFLTAVTVHFFTAHRFPSLQNRFFEAFLVASFVDIVLDIVGAYTIFYAAKVPVWVNLAVNTAFYAFQILIPAMLYMFVLCLAHRCPLTTRRYGCLAAFLPAALLEAACLTNPLSGFFCTLENGVYIRGPLFPLIYLSGIVYTLLAAGTAVKCRAGLPGSQFRGLMQVGVITCACMGLQYFFPQYLLTGVAMSLSILIMYLVLQNPSDLLDQQTRVFGRAGFQRYLQDRLERRKKLQIIAVAMDEMRMVNNVLGIQAGDQLLRGVADFLQAAAPAGHVFRLAGDQFAVVTQNEAKYRQTRQRIEARFREPWDIGGRVIRATASVCCIPQMNREWRADSVDGILNILQNAVLQAKRQGRDVLLEVDDEIVSRLRREIWVETVLRDALRNKTLEVHYQPIYSLREKRFMAAEALARLKSPEGEEIPPGEFIPIAEKHGLISEIGRQVLEKACQMLSSNDLRSMGVSVTDINLSAAEFLQDDLAAQIRGILDRYQVAPGDLSFEITETVASTCSATLAESMAKLSREGIRFSMDDFGTGYANIDSVVRLPFSSVKLDKSMLYASFENRKSAVTFEYTVRMFQQLGLSIIVEGVETMEQVERLEELKVDYIQGYYFARPMAEGQLMRFLDVQKNQPVH